MKRYHIFNTVLFTLFFGVTAEAGMQDVQGSWRHIEDTEAGSKEHILMFCGNYFSWTEYESESGAFISTKGGSWKPSGQGIEVNFEFNSVDKSLVGTNASWKFFFRGEEMLMEVGSGTMQLWRNTDKLEESALSGSWLFSGRERDGEIQRRDNSDQPRKTMKMLSNSRFQWIAFNTETGEFFGTGGGTYELEGDKYIEKIGFFSRDNARVGAVLEFQFEIDNNDWHHRGKSSAGEPMYEIWSLRQ